MVCRALARPALGAWAPLGVLAAAVILAACGGSGFTYVANAEDKVFFKVPDDWAVYDEEDVITPAGGVTATQAADLQERVWLRGFDAARDPSPENVLLRSTNEPRGYAEVRALEPAERDSVSLATLRSSGFPLDPESGEPIDPFAFPQQDPGGLIQVLDYRDDLVLAGGARGTRVTALIDDAQPSVFEQVSVVDAATTTRYFFTIGCSTTCWEANEDVIGEIVDSWTLEEAS